MKREAIVGPGVNKDVAHESVGLKPAALLPKEMPIIKKKNPVLQVTVMDSKVHFPLHFPPTLKYGGGNKFVYLFI